LSHSRQRSIYTWLSVAIAFFTVIVLMAMSASFAVPRVDRSRVLVTDSATGGSGGLPIKYAGRLAAVPGIQSVSWSVAMPITCGAEGSYTTINAPGGSPFGYRHLLEALPKASVAAWQKDQHGLVAGDAAAHECGWRKGQTVTVRSLMSNISGGGGNWSFRIEGVFHSSEDPVLNRIAWAHYRYINAGRAHGKDTVLAYTERVSGVADIHRVADRVDRLFAHSDPPTRTTTITTAQATLARFGDIRSVVVWILGAVFFCMLLVTVNAMSHAAAERRTTLAVLNALGFRRGQLVALFIGETILLVGMGAGAGIGLGILGINLLRPAMISILTRFAVTWPMVGVAVGFGSAAVIISAIAPGIQVASLKTAAHLRA
jgi:putative ABC transport system permease protein